MKKLMLILLGIALSTSMFGQSCLDDVWQCLRNEQAPKAKKFLDECMKSNPESAQVWLMKGNVYYRLYESDMKKLKADPAYKLRYPNAPLEANEAFLQALKLDPNVQPKSAMMGPKLGQQALAIPLYEMGTAAKSAQKYQDAIKCFQLAANNFELGDEKQNAASSYFEAAVCYILMKDAANEKIMLEKAVANGVQVPAAYSELYYLYVADNDTAQCESILKKGMATVSAADQSKLAEARMNYYSMMNDNENLIALAEEVLASIKANPSKKEDDDAMIGICVNYLNNCKAYDKAESILREALEKDPKNFDFLSQMGYRYYEEMHDYMDRVKDLQNQKRWNEANEINLSPEYKQVKETAHEWCERAYEVNSDNLDNNKRLRELKALLQKPIPQELNDKINAHLKQE
ncbi:MAG: hypothetical protein IKU03_08245 [Bacteroidales bacterium]|nr:hypothetical protein [Bacteroidales bacterium]